MRAINSLAAGIVAASLVIAGAPAVHATETQVEDTTKPSLVGFSGIPATVAPGVPFEFDVTVADNAGISSMLVMPRTSLSVPGTPYGGADAVSDPVLNADGTTTQRFAFTIPDVPYGTYTYPLGVSVYDTSWNHLWANYEVPLVVDDPEHPVGNTIAVTGPAIVGGILTAAIEAGNGATVEYRWGNQYESVGAERLMLGGWYRNLVPVKATVSWPDGTVRVRVGKTPRIGIGNLQLDPVTVGPVNAGKTATATYISAAQIPAMWRATQRFQWLLDGTPIPEATTPTYRPTAAQTGKKLQLRVTTLGPYHETIVQTSTTRTIAPALLTAKTPKVSGSTRVGSTLTAVTGAWTKGTLFTYQWTRDGKAIKGATGTTYRTVTADHNKRIAVKVTGKLAGYSTRSTVSAGVTIKLGKLTSPRVYLYGTYEVGQKVWARNYPGETWTSGTKISYQWFRDGKPIKGATGKTYRVLRSDLRHRIAVRLTGTKPLYELAVRTTPAQRIE